VGMGADLLDHPHAKIRLEQAEGILGWSVPAICQDPEDRVSQKLYTQPCLYVISGILADLMSDEGHQPDLVAGHSLGEYVALYVAQVFDFETGLRLVKRRAELMAAASDGMMAAVIGFERAALDDLIQKTPDVVLANDNNAGQVVISGTPTAVEQVLAAIKAKRKVKLNVSGAFHSPLMADASAEFQTVLETTPFQTAQVPVLSNVDPTPALDAAVLQQRLIAQMTGSVRWREISLQLPKEQVEQVVEIGPGKVLTGLIKRTCRGLPLRNVSSAADI